MHHPAELPSVVFHLKYKNSGECTQPFTCLFVPRELERPAAWWSVLPVGEGLQCLSPVLGRS